MFKKTNAFSFTENMEYSFQVLRQLAHPEKAHVLVHLVEHDGDTPEEVSEHLERPLSSVYRYLAEMEPSGLVVAKEADGVRRYHALPFRLLLDPACLREMLRAPMNPAEFYRASLGKRRWDVIAAFAARARAGKITIRQAAARSGLPYREFISLYEALNRSVAKAEAPPRG